MTRAIFPGLPRPLLFGHRGASLKAPENTFQAFELALCLGADVIELDIHLTKDGHVVVIHDPTVDRTTNGTGRVAEMTLKELQELDAGYRFESAPGDFRFRDKGARIETLNDTLQNFAKAAFNIELKAPNMALVTLRVLEQVGPVNALLTAANDAIMRDLESYKPDYPLGLSKAQAFAVLKGAYVGGIPEALHGRALQIPPRYYGVPTITEHLIDKVHAAGIELHLWTLNQERTAKKWLDKGVDGIMSDDPGLLANVVIDAKQRKERA